MNRKSLYRNIDKWRETCHRQRLKYYRKTSFTKNHRKPWTDEEIEMVMLHKASDHAISKEIGRSVQSIQVIRCKEKKRRLSDGRQEILLVET